jgi:tetratricopeptide (TPR) repeat protein
MNWQEIKSKLRETAQYIKEKKILDVGTKTLLKQIPVLGDAVAEYWDSLDLDQAEKALEIAKFLERLSNQEETHFNTLLSSLEEQKRELIAGTQSLNGLLDEVVDIKSTVKDIQKTGDATHLNIEELLRIVHILFNDVSRICKKSGITSASEALEAREFLSESDREIINENESVHKAIRETGIPIIPSYSYQMGLVAVFQGRYLDAENHFKEALAANAEYVEANIGLGFLYQLRANDMLRGGDFASVEQFLKQAEIYVNRALNLDHFDLKALVQAGYIYKEYGQRYIWMQQPEKALEPLEKAKRHFEFVLEKDPQNAGAHNGLGNIYYFHNDLDSAINEHEKAILLQPNYLFAYHDLAGVYLKKGKKDSSKRQECYEKAITEFKETLKLNEQQHSLDERAVEDIRNRIASLQDYLAQN